MEEKLAKANINLIASLERNSELDKDLGWIMAELKKALKMDHLISSFD